eukprot:6187174-Pleurochrysis_carterae.AAC.2
MVPTARASHTFVLEQASGSNLLGVRSRSIPDWLDANEGLEKVDTFVYSQMLTYLPAETTKVSVRARDACQAIFESPESVPARTATTA